MKFFAIIAAAQLATALPLAKEEDSKACSGGMSHPAIASVFPTDQTQLPARSQMPWAPLFQRSLA